MRYGEKRQAKVILWGKGELRVAQKQWEEALATAQRILKKVPGDIAALRMSAVYFLTREPGSARAQQVVSDLVDALDQHEPCNELGVH